MTISTFDVAVSSTWDDIEVVIRPVESSKEKQMTLSIFDVAGYIIQKQGPMEELKLHSLCYYVKAWGFLWNDGKELFPEMFRCGRCFTAEGPWIRLLAEQKLMPSGGRSRIDARSRAGIDAVLKEYGHMSTDALVRLIRREHPPTGAGVVATGIISNEEMRTCYTKDNPTWFHIEGAIKNMTSENTENIEDRLTAKEARELNSPRVALQSIYQRIREQATLGVQELVVSDFGFQYGTLGNHTETQKQIVASLMADGYSVKFYSQGAYGLLIQW